MQRLHVNDLTGFVEASGGFHKLSLPAIAIKDECIPLSDHEAHHRRADDVLHEERDDRATLEGIRDQIGPRTTSRRSISSNPRPRTDR